MAWHGSTAFTGQTRKNRMTHRERKIEPRRIHDGPCLSRRQDDDDWERRSEGWYYVCLIRMYEERQCESGPSHASATGRNGTGRDGAGGGRNYKGDWGQNEVDEILGMICR